MPARIPFHIPEVITRPITEEQAQKGQWSLRLELVDHTPPVAETLDVPDPTELLDDLVIGASEITPRRSSWISYRVRVPLGTSVDLVPYRKCILQGIMNDADPKETAAEASRLKAGKVTPGSFHAILATVLRNTGSRAKCEATTKAIISGLVEVGEPFQPVSPLTDAQVAVWAGRAAGLHYDEMGFMSSSSFVLASQNSLARAALGAPNNASDISMIRRMFAAGVLVPGVPYDPALVAPPAQA